MARFNANKTNLSNVVSTVNLAGGPAVQLNHVDEFVSMALSSLVQDQFYRSSKDTLTRLEVLFSNVDPKFAAKVALFARNEYGMRSISHVIASLIAKKVKGETWTKSFFNKIVVRPDDMAEIITLIGEKEALPNSVKKGFASAFARFNDYSLAKYRMSDKSVSLVDIMNLVHPKRTEAIDQLAKNKLRSFDTWEVEISEAGGDVEKKSEAWEDLIMKGKLGYLALIRNINNILKAGVSDSAFANLILQITNEEKIRESKVFPYTIFTAIKFMESENKLAKSMLTKALEEALDKSVSNVPDFPGRTLCVSDVSSSMNSPMSTMSKMTYMEVGALTAAIMVRKTGADLMAFANEAAYIEDAPEYTTTKLVEKILKLEVGAGTNFASIFAKANKGYDRILIFSDMQDWMSGTHAQKWAEKYSPNVKVFSFDLSGYGTAAFDGKNHHQLFGFSTRMFDFIKTLEVDKRALIKTIEAIEL